MVKGNSLPCSLQILAFAKCGKPIESDGKLNKYVSNPFTLN